MATVNRPSWTEENQVIAPTVIKSNLASPPVARGTLDLRTAFGASLFVYLAKTNTTAPGVAPRVCLCRIRNNNVSVLGGMGIPYWQASGDVTAPNVTTIATGNDPAVDATSIVLTSGTGFAIDDKIAIMDSVSSPTRFCVNTVHRVNSATLYLDNLLKADFAVGDTVSNKADFWNVYVLGGSLYNLTISYEGASTGSDLIVAAYAQIHDEMDQVTA